METLKSTLSAGGGTGTLVFIPPEAFKSKYSEKSDVFSFGVLTHEMLSRQVPSSLTLATAQTKLRKPATESFIFSKALEKRGVAAAEQEQEQECLEGNPLTARMSRGKSPERSSSRSWSSITWFLTSLLVGWWTGHEVVVRQCSH